MNTTSQQRGFPAFYKPPVRNWVFEDRTPIVKSKWQRFVTWIKTMIL